MRAMIQVRRKRLIAGAAVLIAILISGFSDRTETEPLGGQRLAP